MITNINKINKLKRALKEQKLNTYNQIESMFPEFKVFDRDLMEFQIFKEDDIARYNNDMIDIVTEGIYFYNNIYENDKYRIFTVDKEYFETGYVHFTYVIIVELEFDPDRIKNVNMLKQVIKNFVETTINVPEVNKTYLWEDMIGDKLEEFNMESDDIKNVLKTSNYYGFNLDRYHDEIADKLTNFLRTL